MDETLGDLLRKAMQHERIEGGRELGRLAKQRGLSLTHTQINHMLAGTYHSKPKREAIEGIAALARVKVDRVYRAAGLEVPGKPFADELPPDVDLLRPHQRKAVIMAVRAFLKDNTDAVGAGGVTPIRPLSDPASSVSDVDDELIAAMDDPDLLSEREAQIEDP